MLELVRGSITCTGILDLQEVRFCKIDAPGIQLVGILLLVSLTYNEVDMVATDSTIIGQRVLDQRIRIGAAILRQTLVTLVEIHTVALDPC